MVLALPLLYFAMQPPSASRSLGLAWPLLTGALGYLLYFGWQPLRGFPLCRGYGITFTTTLYMTAFVAITVLHMIGHAAHTAFVQQASHRSARV